MKKFIFRFVLISGAVIGIAYWKKDQILDALIQHSIDVDRINQSVDDMLDKAEIVKAKVSEAKQVFNNSKETISDLSTDISDYTADIKPIVNNIKDELNHK